MEVWGLPDEVVGKVRPPKVGHVKGGKLLSKPMLAHELLPGQVPLIQFFPFLLMVRAPEHIFLKELGLILLIAPCLCVPVLLKLPHPVVNINHLPSSAPLPLPVSP